MTRTFPLLAIALALALAPESVAADEESQPVRLELRAPQGCPTAARFWDRVRGRTRRARIAKAGEAARLVRVIIVPDEGSRVSGSVTIDENGGVAARREVGGGACADVADALALVVALAIDPLAQLTAAPVEEPSPDPRPRDLQVIDEEDVARQRRPPPPPPTRWRLGLGAQVAMAMGSAPNALFGAALFGELRAPSTRGAVRLSLEGATSSSTLGPAEARFTLWGGRLDACPVGVAAGAFGIEPCAAFEAGAMVAAGAAVQNAQTHVRPWLAPGAILRARWSFAPARLHVEAEGGALFAIVRDEYFFQPQTSVYAVPLVGARAAVGVGVAFP